jgi:hypothetical protein
MDNDQLNNRMSTDEEEISKPPKPIAKKVDEVTLKKRMDQDKEVRALREEKNRISYKIDEISKRKDDPEQMREEAFQYIQ